ncbi:phage tail protein I [Clostridium sp.]|jgi:phage tail P2-like protein|uniref:phage tail protein I n=1 Tax=Clostridium sp. TaxID=1506 RepID=UPI003EEABDB0
MINLANSKLLDILPPNLRNDPEIIAASKAVDKEFSNVVNSIKNVFTIADIKNASSDIIDHIAVESHADFYDLNLEIEIRRALAEKAIELHMNKGTLGAVEEAAKIVFGRSWVEEWYEYGGNPYMFKMNLEISNRGASPDDLKLLDQLINAYKNKRSWLETINIFLTTNGSVFFGGCMNSGEEITVYPWSPTETISMGKINLSSGHQLVETTIIYPKEAS